MNKEKNIRVKFKSTGQVVYFKDYNKSDYSMVGVYLSKTIMKSIFDNLDVVNRNKYIVLTELINKGLNAINDNPDLFKIDVRDYRHIGFESHEKKEYLRSKIYLERDADAKYKNIFGNRYASMIFNRLLTIGYEEYTKKQGELI